MGVENASPGPSRPSGVDDPVVSVEALRKVYEPSPLWMRALLRTSVRDPVVALDDVNLEVRPGEILAVVGPNGAGKSTLFRVLTGLTTATDGRAVVLGHDVRHEAARVRSVVGFMPSEDRSLWLRHTCRENLVFHGELHGYSGRPLRRRIDELLDLVGLGDAKQRVGFALSSGMRARLQLARALLHDPKVLILDEPTGTVDPVGSYELIEFIKKVTLERQIGVLISSHRLDEIEVLHDRILLLNKGRTVYYGPLRALQEIWEAPRLEVTFHAPTSADEAERIFERAGIDVINRDEVMVLADASAGVGKLMTMLGSLVDDISLVRERRMPLQELLATVLRQPHEPPAGDSGGGGGPA